jgi:hypothetical protein
MVMTLGLANFTETGQQPGKRDLLRHQITPS